jgi:hypothetical protein
MCTDCSTRTGPTLWACLALAAFGRDAHAQWTAIRLLPQGSLGSEVRAVAPGQAYGFAGMPANNAPAIWDLPGGALTALGPPAATGAITGMFGDQLVGHINGHAAMWVGAEHTQINLPDVGYYGSSVLATSGEWQAGGVGGFLPGSGRAAVWHNGEEPIILHPQDGYESAALAADGQYQGGWVRFYQSNGFPAGNTHAVVWSGTAQSMIDLNGNHEGSVVNGMFHGQIVGGVDSEAALWPDLSSSFIPLNPPGVTAAQLYGTCGSAQVGQAVTNFGGAAAIWFGTAESFTPLNFYLPPNYRASGATSVCESNGMFYVGGWAINSDTGREEGFVWVGVPEPAPLALFVAFTLAASRRRPTRIPSRAGTPSSPPRLP